MLYILISIPSYIQGIWLQLAQNFIYRSYSQQIVISFSW